jgi:hypothetical protein
MQAEPFGIPARNGAQAITESIHRGEALASYYHPGIAVTPLTEASKSPRP